MCISAKIRTTQVLSDVISTYELNTVATFITFIKNYINNSVLINSISFLTKKLLKSQQPPSCKPERPQKKTLHHYTFPQSC